MLLKDLIKDLDIVYSKGNLDIDISGIAYDSRKSRPGYMFVCIEGYKTDGHKYVPQALENGAKVLLVQKDVEIAGDDITVVKVKDSRYALASTSSIYFGNPSEKFNLVGITGTKGKTTTTYMIKSILETMNKKVGLIGSLGSMIGDEAAHTERTTPESYDLQSLFGDMAAKSVESVVMEVSSQGLELHRVSCCNFDIGVFTNLSQDHISPNEHGSMEEYFNAKRKLFKMCGKAVVNADSPYGKKVIDSVSCEVLRYGIENDAEIKAVNIKLSSEHVEFEVNTPWGSTPIKVNIPGRFSIYNSLAAIGVCGLLGAPLVNIASGLEKVGVPGRAEIVNIGRDYSVMIDFAHTPDSLENILRTVKAHVQGRLVCLFGCGGDRDRTKRPIMGKISGEIADFTVITSDNPRTEEPSSIIDDIEKGIKGTNAAYIKIIDRRQAIKYALENAKKGDVIVLAGKGHETYQMFGDRTIHFDEREVVKELLEEC